MSREVGPGSTAATNLSNFKSEYSFSEKASRAIWNLVWCVLFRPSPRIFFAWRRWLLRRFGAQIGDGAKIYNSVRFFLPANATIGEHAVIGPQTDFYDVAPITIGAHSVVSQYSYLCAATHDYTLAGFPLVPKSIEIGRGVWICAGAYIGPGVQVGDEAIVGARAAVFGHVEGSSIVGGNPAKFIKDRPPISNSSTATK